MSYKNESSLENGPFILHRLTFVSHWVKRISLNLTKSLAFQFPVATNWLQPIWLQSIQNATLNKLNWECGFMKFSLWRLLFVIGIGAPPQQNSVSVLIIVSSQHASVSYFWDFISHTLVLDKYESQLMTHDLLKSNWNPFLS